MSTEIDPIIRTGFLDVLSGLWAPRNRLSWTGYRNLAFPFAEIPSPEFRLVPLWNLDQLISYLGTWSAARRYIESNGDGFLRELSAALGTAWGDRDLKRPISMDFHLRVGRQES